jgi:3-deoxy-D-manno-octulosonic-acid transferase
LVQSRPDDQPQQLKRNLIAWAYNLALVLLLGPAALYLLWRLVIVGKSRAGFGQRLGFLPASLRALGESGEPVVWIQAVSVGEVAAAGPFIRQLRLIEPDAHIVLSTTTPTGQRLAQSTLAGEVDAIFYFPFDFPVAVQMALSAVNPRLLVMVETELWPNILATAKRRGVATAIINGRISDGAFRKDLAARPLFAWALSHVDLVCAQSEPDVERFRRLGADPERLLVTGNTKFDEQFPLVSDAEAAKWRQDLGIAQEAPVLLAGSTHPGEEAILLDLYSELRAEQRDLQLILAPRHPERGDEIERLVNDRGYASHRRSRALTEAHGGGVAAPAVGGPEVRIAILDTIGELARVFRIATVVFMGGSLVPSGGHNALQAVAQGRLVVTGPHNFNFRDITDILVREGVARVVPSREELGVVIGELLRSPDQQQTQEQRGPAVLAKYGGAAARIAQAVDELLH